METALKKFLTWATIRQTRFANGCLTVAPRAFLVPGPLPLLTLRAGISQNASLLRVILWLKFNQSRRVSRVQSLAGT